MDYKDLSLEDLKKIKKEWCANAKADGSLIKIYLVGRVLGERIPHNYGPKYRWQYQGINLYIDDYGDYMTVDYNGKRVCNRDGNYVGLFIPGEWMNIISEAAIKAKEIQKQREIDREEEERQNLLKELGLN